jgi:hypothetical protein
MNNVIRFPVQRTRRPARVRPFDRDTLPSAPEQPNTVDEQGYYDLALEQLLLVLAGKSASPECQQLQAEMRRQWPCLAGREAARASQPWR